jgi:hypothetical protein
VKHTVRCAAAALAVLAAAGCGTTGNHTGAGHSSSSAITVPAGTPPATPVAATASCLTQFHKWWAGGASAKFSAVITGLEKADKVADNVGALQAAVAQTAADSKAFLAQPAPACVRSMRTDLDTALNDFIAAAAYIDRGGASNLHTGALRLKAGAAAMQRVASDLAKTLL